MNILLRAFGLVLALQVVVGLAGCDNAPPVAARAPVKGTVTLDGASLADGEVYFKAPDNSLNILPVKAGNFTGEASVGTCRVEVYAYKITPIDPGQPGYTPEGSKTNTIPDKFNTNSTLTADVKKEGANDFKFEVTSM